jgi:hypothetical protein
VSDPLKEAAETLARLSRRQGWIDEFWRRVDEGESPNLDVAEHKVWVAELQTALDIKKQRTLEAADAELDALHTNGET